MQCYGEGTDCAGVALLDTATAEECCLGDGFWFDDGEGCIQCIGMSSL